MKKLIKIYGERNTGTNYIDKIIRMNLEVRLLRGIAPRYVRVLQHILPGKQAVKDQYFAITYKNNLGWKHTRVNSISELQRYKILRQETYFITVTKNPYAWLLSLHRRPYHQYYKTKPDFETFLRTPWKTVGRDNCEKLLRNPIELWNIKNRSYLQLNSNNCTNITAESVLRDPKGLIDKLSDTFSIQKSSGYFSNLDESTKDKRKNFEYYNDYYMNERWKKDLSGESISIINEKLDKRLVEHFGYELLP